MRFTQKNKDMMIGTIVTILTMLLSFLAYSFVSSLATKSSVSSFKSEYKSDLKHVNKEIKLLQNAFCIVDKRTCKIFQGDKDG